jgi:hypothetical protein
MKNTINFIKYHTIEFSKLVGLFAGTLLLFVLGIRAGEWAYGHLFPIIGNWFHFVTLLVFLLPIYVLFHLYFPNNSRETKT